MIPVDPLRSDAALAELIEDAWKAGRTPDLRTLLDSVAENDPERVIPDLIMIDMEWRWKSGNPQLYRDLRDYEAILNAPLSTTDRAMVLCREFGIRNRWGDCLSRKQLCERHPELADLFLRNVNKEIRDIADWPKVSLLRHGMPIASTNLDRPVTAGRQSSSIEVPWSILTSDFHHHLVLCDMDNPQLSREQLELTLLPEQIISIRNTSASRAISVRSSRTAIDAGQTYLCGLEKPILIHLIGHHDIFVTRSDEPELPRIFGQLGCGS
jgi:hypothetical protein